MPPGSTIPGISTRHNHDKLRQYRTEWTVGRYAKFVRVHGVVSGYDPSVPDTAQQVQGGRAICCVSTGHGVSGA
eukprot:830014-Rhodomonas_salina.1